MITNDDYAEKIFFTLPSYSRVASGGMFKLNAKCPVCNDKTSPRLWYYSNNQVIVCYNCGLRSNVRKFIDDHRPDLYGAYLQDSRRESGGVSARVRSKSAGDSVIDHYKNEAAKIPKLEYCQRLDKLPINHPIVKYVTNRAIPRDQWHRLWFTTKWMALVNTVKPGTYPIHMLEHDEPRLVIPIFNSDNEIESMQGRDLAGRSKAKYLTIKASEDSTKIYGLETIQPSLTLFILEGPIDTLFLDNAIAITGGELSLDLVPGVAGKRVWVMDNEPRSKDTIHRMERLIDKGERVVIFDRAPWKSKDINDMVKDEGATKEQLMDYFRNNGVTGLMAKHRLNNWKKI